ncbi:sensor domain-containing diguanylate cyclase [Cognaticolwellia beringensis]|nr:GGDEF domain-containing protein [Cognaticolwellia beringensis]
MRNLFRASIWLFIPLLMSTMASAQGVPVFAKPSLLLQLHIQHIFIGSSLILSLMCFAWARALRSYSMAILALFFAIKSLGILVAGGFSFFALFTSNIHLLNTEGVLLSNLSNILFFIFTVKLFTLKKHDKNSYQLLLRLAIIMTLTVPLSFVFSHSYTWLLTQIPISMSLLALLYVNRTIKVGDEALSKMFSWILVVQLSFNTIAYLLYYLSFSTQAINCLDMLSFWVMAIMMTYLIGHTYYCHLRDEKLAQQQATASALASSVAQQELLALQDESQEQLESRVQERTLELNIALQELEAVNQELKEKNTLDELSGLYNRRYYDQKILAEFRRSRRNLTPLSLILIDIDHFKKVNDSFGHLVGDKCIVEVASMIKSLLRRSSDVSCRYGGEEFCLILPETDEKGALALAEEICQSVRQQVIPNNEKAIKLTVSCGVTTYLQEKDVTPEIIFECVDKALYKAKQAGRDQVQVMPIKIVNS